MRPDARGRCLSRERVPSEVILIRRDSAACRTCGGTSSGTGDGRPTIALDPLRAFDGIVRTVRVEGASAGSLAGTTFVVKDLYDVSGCATGAGNPDWERTHAIPTRT